MAIVDIQDVGLVEVPDDISDEQLTDVARRLHQGRLASFGSAVAREPGRMAGQSMSALARFGQMFGESFGTPGGEGGMSYQDPAVNPLTEQQRPGPERAKELESDSLYRAGQQVTKSAEEAFPTNPLYADKFETAVGSGIGSVIGLLPSALAGPAAPLVAGGIYGGSQGEAMAQEAGRVVDARIEKSKAEGDTITAATLERNKFDMQSAAALANAAIGTVSQGALGVASRLVPIAAGTSEMGKMIASKGAASPVAQGAIEGFIREGAQETTEQIAQNLAARAIYDPEQKPLEGIGMAGGAGGVVGAMFGGAAGAFRRRSTPLKSSVSEQKVAPGASTEVDKMVEALSRATLTPDLTDEDVLTAPIEAPAAVVPATPVVTPQTQETQLPEQSGVPTAVLPEGGQNVSQIEPEAEVQSPVPSEVAPVAQPISTEPTVATQPVTEEQQAPAAVSQAVSGQPQAEVQNATENQVQATSGLPPIQGQPADVIPAGEAQAGTALGGGANRQGVEGQVAEPPVAKMQAEVHAVASTEGKRSAKEIKSELVTRLEGALKTAPEEQNKKSGLYVTIEIPGDGTFTVANDEEHIGKLLKRAKKISVSPSDEPSKIRIPVDKRPLYKVRQDIENELATLRGKEEGKQDSDRIALLEKQSAWLEKQIKAPSSLVKEDPIEAALNKAIDATNPAGHAFDFVAGVSYAVAHTALRIAKAIYVATRDMVAAVNAALQHMQESNPNGFNVDEAREKIQALIETGGDVIAPRAASGALTQESEGRFIGPITRDTDKQWNETATEWIDQFGDDLQTALEKATSPNYPMDGSLRQYVLTQIVTRSNEQAEKAKNSVDVLRALRIQEQASRALTQSGAIEFGKVGAARNLAMNRINWLMPVLAYRNLVRSAQSRLPFPELTSEHVRKWLRNAGRRAVNETRESMRSADNIVARELRREVRDMDATWREILTSSMDVQGDFRRSLYAAVLSNQNLQGISPQATAEIVNILANEWERQRMRIFRQEFRKEVPLPNVSDPNVAKLESALPAIVIQANLGMLDDEAFRNAIAPKFGVAAFDGPTAQVVNKLAQEAQALPEGVLRDRKISQIMDAIHRSDTVRWRDVFRDYWYAAMLSGIRTQVDNAMSIINGTLNVGMAMVRNPESIPLQTAAYWQGLSEAAGDFVPILKGERWRMHNIDVERPSSALEAMLRSQNFFARLLGNAAFVGRLIGAFDHLNALSTRNAMLAWGMFRLNPEQAKQSLSVSSEDRSNARERAIQEGTPNNLLNKRVREILEERFPVEQVMNAIDLGRQVSFQNEPYGMAGHFYRFIQSLDKMPGLGSFTRIISGTAFARYALNYTNDILNYVAPISLYRWYRSSPDNLQPGESSNPEARELILMKAAVGTLVGAVAAAVFLGDDEDDERKRAIDITGSFRSLSTQQKNQLLSEGRQPYSLRFGDTYVSYRQLPIAGILSSVGELRDRQLFDKEHFDKESVAIRLGNATLAGMMIVRDSSAVVGLMDLLGFAQSYKYDVQSMADKTVPKFVGRLLGSTIPNIAKEIDAWTDPGLYKANVGWEFFMQQTPWLRTQIPPGPAVDVFGDKIKVERLPWSRWIRQRKEDPEWITLGSLASKGVFLPMAGRWKVVAEDGTRRDPTPEEMLNYQKQVGAEYRRYIQENGADLLAMDPGEANDRIDKETSKLRKSIRDSMK